MTFEPIDFGLYHPCPLMIVISGPSGVGKDAVLNAMKRRSLPLHFVVTLNSRPMRPGEQEGVDYFFITREAFEQEIALGHMLEYAHVYDDYKGIPRSQVDEALASGKDVVFRLDVQGAAKIRMLYPDAVLIFLIPSSHDEWLPRITQRKTETLENFTLRVETARQEVQRIPEFDYLVVNAAGQLDQTVDVIQSIIIAEHHRPRNQKVVE
jgi:guanylate kinase